MLSTLDSHTIFQNTPAPDFITANLIGLVDQSYYGLDWTANLAAASSSKVDGQSDCPAERSISLNYPPMMVSGSTTLQTVKGEHFYLGLLKDANEWPPDIEGEYTILRLPDSWFSDNEKDYPLSVVADQWSVDGFPGTLRFDEKTWIFYSAD